MFTLRTFTSILAFLSFSVRAFPLSQRDVIAPQILEPNANSVWPIGTQQIVIWNTSDFPSEITNPIGQVILGFNESNSLNLDFGNPLAQGFELTDGNVTITVPNVPPRDDYIIVLIGDSGDTSPAFAITRISSPSSDTPLSSSSSSSGSISGATISGTTLSAISFSTTSSVTIPTFLTDYTSTTVGTSTVLPSTGTTTGSTSSSSISNSNSNSASVVSSALTPSSTSAGRSLRRSSWSSVAPFLMSVAPFVMCFMV